VERVTRRVRIILRGILRKINKFLINLIFVTKLIKFSMNVNELSSCIFRDKVVLLYKDLIIKFYNQS